MGEDYPIKSDADEVYLRELAEYVEGRVASVASRSHLPPRLKREILAALLIADDYFMEKRKNAELERKIGELTSAVNNVLDGELLLED